MLHGRFAYYTGTPPAVDRRRRAIQCSWQLALRRDDTKAIRYAWQLPQNLIGLVLSAVVRSATVDRFERGGGVIFRCFHNYGGVSLGSYVFVHVDAGDDLIRHELGHCRQSMLLGPLYLLVIGLPSIVWAAVYSLLVRRNPDLEYFRFYTERWANHIAGLLPPRSNRRPKSGRPRRNASESMQESDSEDGGRNS